MVAGGGGSRSPPPSDNFLGALKSKRGAKIRNSNVKYYTKYVKSSLSNKFKDTQASYGKGPDCFLLKTAIFPISVFLLLFSMKFHTELENDQHDSFQ